jgi:hypothetical protein
VLILSGATLADALQFSSNKFLYSISLPDGWIQIPDAEIARFKENLPPQAQHLIYDAAFQRGNAGKWFEWPYVMVQVSPPPARMKIKRLPTEEEFQQFISVVSSSRAVSKLKEAIDAVPNPEDKMYLNSLLPSLSKPTVQVNVASRKYWFVIDGNDPVSGPMKVYSAATFMSDGNIIMLHAYTKASRFSEDLGQFLLISRSLRMSPNK